MLITVEVIICAYSRALFRQCALPAGRALSGFVYRIRQAVCKLRVCLCTSTSDAGINAPRWAQIGNVCVSFHAVSIHTEKVPRLPVVLPRRPRADIGTRCPDNPPGEGF